MVAGRAGIRGALTAAVLDGAAAGDRPVRWSAGKPAGGRAYGCSCDDGAERHAAGGEGGDVVGRAAQAPGSKIVVNVNLVLVPMTVTDPMNRLVTGLEKDNFSSPTTMCRRRSRPSPPRMLR